MKTTVVSVCAQRLSSSSCIVSRVCASRAPNGSSIRSTDAPLATSLAPGYYELVFEVGDYFAGQGMPTFFYEIPIRFHVRESGVHYHVPLLLSPWGYSTYRGS